MTKRHEKGTVMLTNEIDAAALARLTLAKGGHSDPDAGLCLMEAVAYVRGMPHTDHPPCVSPILGAFGRNLNDVLPDDMRQDLKALIPLLPGTANDGHDEARGYLALDWLIRVYTPTWLELAGITEEARTLRKLGRIVDLAAAKRAKPAVLAGREKAAAAGAAAWDAAWDAAWAAAGAAAWAAAGDALAPTAIALQRSAIELYTSMVKVGRSEASELRSEASQ